MTAGLATAPRDREKDAEAAVPDLVLPAVTVRGRRRISPGNSGGFLARLRDAAIARQTVIIDLSTTEALDRAVAREIAGLYRVIQGDGRHCGVVCTCDQVLARFTPGSCRVDARFVPGRRQGHRRQPGCPRPRLDRSRIVSGDDTYGVWGGTQGKSRRDTNPQGTEADRDGRRGGGVR